MSGLGTFTKIFWNGKHCEQARQNSNNESGSCSLRTRPGRKRKNHWILQCQPVEMINPSGLYPHVLIVSSRWLSYGHREPVAHKLRVLFTVPAGFRKGRNVLRPYSTILKILPPERHHLNRTIPLFNRQIHIRVIRRYFSTS